MHPVSGRVVAVSVRAALIAGFGAYRRALLAHPTIVLLMTERGRFS